MVDALVPETAAWGAGDIRPDLADGNMDGLILLLTAFKIGLNIVFHIKILNSFRVNIDLILEFVVPFLCWRKPLVVSVIKISFFHVFDLTF